MPGTPQVDKGSGHSEWSEDQNQDHGSDSDSEDSIFITQKPIRSRRRRGSEVKKSSRSDKGNAKSISQVTATKDKKRSGKVKLPVYSFCLNQEKNSKRLVLNNHQNTNIHNALMRGFFCSVQERQAECEAGDLLSSLPTVDQEGDFIAPISEDAGTLEEEGIKVVKKKDLVVFSKTKRPQPWYNPQRANQQSRIAAATSSEGFREASPSSPTNENSPGKRQTPSKWTRNRTQASEAKRTLVFQQREKQDETSSDSDATYCELPDDFAQNADAASTAGAELQADEEEEPEAGGQNDADGGDHESREEEMDYSHEEPEGLNMSSSFVNGEDETPHPQEGIDTPDSKQMKKKKKKRRLDEDVYGNIEDNSAILNSGVMNEEADERKISDEDQERLKSDEAADVQNYSFTIQKKKMKKSNSEESGICLESAEASEEVYGERGKKKKKKKKHQSESENENLDVTSSNDAIIVEESQELMVKKKSFFESDGSRECTAEGAEDKDAELMTERRKKKKKKLNLNLNLNLGTDAVPESDDSVSVQKTEEKKQTSSFLDADAEKSANESAETSKHDQVRKKKKKRMLEAAANNGTASEELQMDEAKRKKEKHSVVTPTGQFESAAGAGWSQIDEDEAVTKKKKKKKKKDTGEVEFAPDSWSSLAHEMDAETEHIVSPSTHTNNASNDVKKKKEEKEKG
ncbi:unnamed protein product [Ophioblennius macclurei]